MPNRAAIVTLHSALPVADGAAPEWLHLVPVGTFRGTDGRGPYRNPDSAALAQQIRTPFPVDEMHATHLGGAALGMAAPARGWVVELQARADGVWGRVEWTAAGRELVADRAYRGLSPALRINAKTGQVIGVDCASLTNAPNLPQLITLHSQQGDPMNPETIARLRTLLGLDGDADDTAIITALEQVVGDRAMQSQQFGTLAVLAGAAKDAQPAAVITALQSRLAAAGDAGAQITALQSQVATLEADRKREKATAAIDAAIAAGKPVGAKLRDHYIALHMQNPAAVEEQLKLLPDLNAGGLKPRRAPDADGLDAADAAVIALMGVDRAEYLKTKAANGEQEVH